jgi:ATP-dependent DNA helicase RecG
LLSGAQYNAKSDQTVTGNILELIERGWDSVRPQLVQTRLGRAARFESTMMYPELACREALVNAIAHRDYAEEGRAIEIFVFDDRMEVKNPGSLLSSVSMDDLLKLEGVHQSRNALSCRVLRELGYMRELGEGMRRMFNLMRVSELTEPELNSAGNSFSVILRHTTIYNQPQLLWLQQFDEFNLDREQKAIVVLGIGGALVAPQDIWDNLGIVDTEHYRQLVRSLQDLGVLTSQIPKYQAQNQARRKGIPVRKIARFRISPKNVEASGPVAQARKADMVARDAALDAPDPSARLWIANLDFKVTEQALVEFLSNYGTVENVYMPRGFGGNPKGFAFVEFSDENSAMDVMARANGELLGHRRLVVRRATPRIPGTNRS